MRLTSLLAALSRRRASPRATPIPPPGPSAPPPLAGSILGLPRDPVLDRITGPADELDQFLALPPAEQMRIIEAELDSLGPDEQRLILGVLRKNLGRAWIPQPGPQTAALRSQADEMLYGGAAGSGKSSLLIGCAVTEHQRALILRRQSTELDGLIADSREVIGARASYNATIREWSFPDGRNIKLGGCKEPDDWRDYAGRARDLIGIDEAGEFLEEQVSSLIAWCRSTDPAQRCRVILASNPPRGAEGQWLIDWFAPWLLPGHPIPAAPGELRWYVRAGGETRWIDGPEPVTIDGETYTPRSRTFIPGRLEDNAYLARTSYRASLENLPEPLRSQLLKGDFLAGREDDDWQVIPTAWIEAAQERWTQDPPSGRTMTCLGVDVAQGGADETVMIARYGAWFGMPVARKGVDTKDGGVVAGLIFATMRHDCQVVIDLGGGWGGDAFGHLKEQGIACEGFLGVNPSSARTQDGKMGFRNLRAETWWRLREALDPVSGQRIALPPDPKLALDLATPRWKLVAGGLIQVEAKDDIRKRLGRSPDRGDAATMAWAYGGLREHERAETARQQAKAVLGYASVKEHHWKHARPVAAQPRVNLGYAHGRR